MEGVLDRRQRATARAEGQAPPHIHTPAWPEPSAKGPQPALPPITPTPVSGGKTNGSPAAVVSGLPLAPRTAAPSSLPPPPYLWHPWRQGVQPPQRRPQLRHPWIQGSLISAGVLQPHMQHGQGNAQPSGCGMSDALHSGASAEHSPQSTAHRAQPNAGEQGVMCWDISQLQAGKLTARFLRPQPARDIKQGGCNCKERTWSSPRPRSVSAHAPNALSRLSSFFATTCWTHES